MCSKTKKIFISGLSHFKWNLFFVLLTSYYLVPAQSIWTAGPMLHFNIGGGKSRTSFGVEFAYWNFSRFPYSYDFCAEFASKRIRLYSELQTGVGIAGISGGPVLEFQTDSSRVKLGFQASIWANYYLGVDMRVRFIDKKAFFCPGTYVKVGFNARDENGEKVKLSEFSSDYDD